jgi:hypothetical protein
VAAAVNAAFAASLAQSDQIPARDSVRLKLRSNVLGVCASTNPLAAAAQIGTLQ